MKYSCNECGCEVKADEFPEGFGNCPSCGENDWCKIPEFETVFQWEARTGLKYPEKAPVYEKRFFLKPDAATVWICHEYKYALRDRKDYPKRTAYNIITAAAEAGAPPENWRPEYEEE